MNIGIDSEWNLWLIQENKQIGSIILTDRCINGIKICYI